MTYVGSVNILIKGQMHTIPVNKIMYQNRDDARPAGGIVENPDGSLQIILDGRLSDDAIKELLEEAMAEVSRRISVKGMN